MIFNKAHVAFARHRFVSATCRSIENPVYANSGYPGQSPHCVVSDLGLLCLHMSNKKDAKFIWVGLFTHFSIYTVKTCKWIVSIWN